MTELEKYMEKPLIIFAEKGCQKIKNRDIFFYPWDDLSPKSVSRFIAEQKRISKIAISKCQYCDGEKMKKLMYFDDRRGRRHVRATCTECWNDLGYVSDVPNPGNKMPYGKYRGLTMEKLFILDPGYVTWFISSCVGGDPSKTLIIEALETAIDGANTEHRSYVIPSESYLKKLELLSSKNL